MIHNMLVCLDYKPQNVACQDAGLFMARTGHILVAYDGSTGSRRALSAVADLWKHWKGESPRVLLLGVLAESADSDDFLQPARRYLEGYNISYRELLRPGKPGEVVLQVAAEEHVDLMCMGGFGHSVMRAILLGSTTQVVLKHSTCPVLLVH